MKYDSVMGVALTLALGIIYNTPGNALEARALLTTNLSCEYVDNPLGVDRSSPLLSWKVDSNERAQRQTAYQILVSTSDGALVKNKGDM